MPIYQHVDVDSLLCTNAANVTGLTVRSDVVQQQCVFWGLWAPHHGY